MSRLPKKAPKVPKNSRSGFSPRATAWSSFGRGSIIWCQAKASAKKPARMNSTIDQAWCASPSDTAR